MTRAGASACRRWAVPCVFLDRLTVSVADVKSRVPLTAQRLATPVSSRRQQPRPLPVRLPILARTACFVSRCVRVRFPFGNWIVSEIPRSESQNRRLLELFRKFVEFDVMEVLVEVVVSQQFPVLTRRLDPAFV